MSNDNEDMDRQRRDLAHENQSLRRENDVLRFKLAECCDDPPVNGVYLGGGSGEEDGSHKRLPFPF
jgi:hypothetical protein